MKKAWVCFFVAVLILLGCKSTWAEGFALYEWGARGTALGGATMARPADPSAVASNPAQIIRLPGIQIQAGFTAIMPSGSMRLEDPAMGVDASSNIKHSIWYIPHAYYTQRINDSFTVGVGGFSRFGLGFEYQKGWPGRYNIYNLELTTLSVNPVLAWKVNDSLSMAGGIELMYLDIGLNKMVNPTFQTYGPGYVNFGGADPLDVDSDMDADSLGVGFNLGLLYKLNDEWAIGLAYRSQVSHRAEGENEFTPQTGDPATAGMLGSVYKNSDMHASVVLPDSISGGVAWTPRPDLSIEAGAVWTRWSSFRTLRIHLEDPMDTVGETKMEWKNSWRFNLGVEYWPADWLALRAGYVYDMSPMSERCESYLVPTEARNIYSLGVGFAWENVTLDLAYSFVDAKGRRYSARPEDGVLNSYAERGVSNQLAVSVGYKF